MTEVFAVLGDGGTVLAANNRLARSVTLAFNRRQREAGLRAWRSPAVLTWRAWVEALCARSLARGGQAGRRSLLADHQARLLWRRVLGTAADELLPGAAGPVADLAGQAWRAAQDWRIGLADLAAAADSEDSSAFAAWAAEYRRRCEATGWTDLGAATESLVADFQSGVLSPPPRIHLAGFADRTPLQEELLRVVASRGCLVSEDTARPRPHADLRHVRCHDGKAEIEQAARWARQLRVASPAAVVGIVVPDLARRLDEVRRSCLDIVAPDWRLAPDHDHPVNFSMGQALADVGLVRAALSILRCIPGSVDYRLAGELLATRYLPGHDAERSDRARLDLDLRDRIGAEIRVAEIAAAARDTAPMLASRLAAFLQVTERLPRRQPAADWAASFRSVLEAMGWPGDAALASDEYQAGMAWQELLDQLRSCDALLGALEATAALAVIDSLARHQLFQPAGDPAAIQVLGVMEAVGQQFDALWVSGMTSDAWPPPARTNPLLPLRLQRERRLPDSSPALARERAERLLRWLETAAPTVVFSSPEFAGEEPLAASPLLGHLPMGPSPGGWTGPRWIDQILSAAGLEQVTPDPPPPVARGTRLRGGAALLEREARCPARAFVEFRLGARELPVPASGIDALTRGSITHRALETIFREVDSHATLSQLAPGDETRLLDAAIDGAMRDFLPSGNPLLHRIGRNERERQRRLLGEFLRLERQRDGFRVLRVEALPGESALPAALASLGIRLRADRIDEMPDGRRLVIDYKTGARIPGAKELWGDRPRSPQLPLYALLADAGGVAFAQVATAGVGWRGVAHADWGIAGIVTAEELTDDAVTDWGALRAGWWTALDRLATEIVAGCFDVDRWRLEDARGEWAMAIRPHDLAAAREDAP